MNFVHSGGRSVVLFAVAGSVALLAGIGEARAQDPDGALLPPSTHSAWYAASIGPSIGLDSFGGTQFSLVNEAGWHLNGGSDGPAIGGSFHLGFGNAHVRVSPQARFWWDIPVAGRYPVYVTPSGGLGYAGFFSTYTNPFTGQSVTNSSHAFVLQASVAGRVILENRAFLAFQPVGFEVFIGDGTAASYNILFSGGFTFY